ncbi:MAG: gliding motility-associated C-terminal domain-containing protein [Bacteroidales bacterium]|nr:gliding motility-associated C-terminal domain-containing protein [Bacteroidales bacterium]
MKKIGLTILFFLSAHVLYATHFKAAEITFIYSGGGRHDFILTTFTAIPPVSFADNDYLTINWRGIRGGGGTLVVPRSFVRVDASTMIRESRYEFYISFPGEGTFFISMEQANRNGGVINVPNSINIPIFVETSLVISSAMGTNSSPILLNPPIDQGCFGIPFMHNPGAFDPDGDSLSFRFIPCRGADGLDIPNFRLPSASDSISINPVTGDLIWASPQSIGDFNIAILIEEFRNGIRIGSVTRDMQISIQHCNNRPPELFAPEHLCVFAGDTLRIPVRATDLDPTDILTLSATGGMLAPIRNDAVFTGSTGVSPVYDTLIWVPQHSDVQQQPHPIYFRARDNGTPNLNALRTTFVQVIGRAPAFDSIVPTFDAISLHWTPVSDESVLGYRIYRALSRSGITQDSCEFGFIDANYQRIADLRGDSISVFVDSAVSQNFLYCYRIVRVYRNGTLSQMSDEFCTSLLSKTSIIEKVSIVETDENFGEIQLVWRHPLDFDVTTNHDDFRYVIHRLTGQNFVVLDTNQIQDTTFLDTQLNTRDFPHTYKIELIERQDTSWISRGFSSQATSVFINAVGRNRRVNIAVLQTSPSWITERFEIYRKMEWQSNSDFIFVGYTTLPNFTDTTGLINDSTYTYKVKAFGRHFNERINDYVLINWSQKVNATPVIGPPCVQQLEVFPNCNPLQNQLEWWSVGGDDCDDENLTFHIFFSTAKTGNFTRIDSVNFGNTFIHQNAFVGCYFVTASNERNYFSEPSDTICILFQQFHDECMHFEIPNVFTPNGDGINDEFKINWRYPLQNIVVFTIRIFNRWGNLVFESNDPNFEWDGNNQATGRPAPDGTYFYVIEFTLPGGEPFIRETLSGSVTILR